LVFPELPDAQQVLQNEEHLVLETSEAHQFSPGDELLAIPRHVCPTSALHKEAILIENGRAAGFWPVTARDRKLTV
jgi:D-threonine aldolase